MRMRGIFCGSTAQTDEEYRVVVRRRMVFDALLAAITVAVVWAASHLTRITMRDYSVGFFAGIGTGFLVGD